MNNSINDFLIEEQNNYIEEKLTDIKSIRIENQNIYQNDKLSCEEKIKKSWDNIKKCDKILKDIEQNLKEFKKIKEVEKKIIDKVISFIGKKEWWEESEDYYRKHFWLKEKYRK